MSKNHSIENIERGMVAWSRAGHDIGKLYVIIAFDEQYAYLADGKIRTLENPKKKKWKHIQVRKKIQEELSDLSWDDIRDEQIKRAVKIAKKQEV